MSLLKYVDRLKLLDHFIKNRSTGDAKSFAKKVGISTSQIKAELRQMRQMGADIKYSRHFKSYVYQNDCRLIIFFDNERNGTESSNPSITQVGQT